MYQSEVNICTQTDPWDTSHHYQNRIYVFSLIVAKKKGFFFSQNILEELWILKGCLFGIFVFKFPPESIEISLGLKEFGF